MSNNHARTKRIGNRKAVVTLPGRCSNPEQPKQVIHDRRAANDNLPANACVALIEIDDPYTPAGQEKPDRIVVVRSLRDDPLAWLHSHRRINDAQYAAGRR